jgi:hypothetical protein
LVVVVVAHTAIPQQTETVGVEQVAYFLVEFS